MSTRYSAIQVLASLWISIHPSRSLILATASRTAGEGTGHGEAILAARNLAVKIPHQVGFEYACFATLGKHRDERSPCRRISD